MSGFVSTGKMPGLLSLNQDQSSEDSGAETKIDSFPGKSLDLSIKWLQPCLADDADKGKLIINRFLLSDMKLSCGGGHGMLPKDIHTVDGIILRDALVLQVDEIVDITYNPAHRLVGVPQGFKRMLMLSMTDGVQCVYGMEDRPIKDIQVFALVVVDNVKVRDGSLMLEPGHLKVLGGMVEHLAVERQRSEEFLRMQDWIKATPTPAAWKPNGVDSRVSGVAGFNIADNSTWHDAFSFRLFILIIKTMSAHLSFRMMFFACWFTYFLFHLFGTPYFRSHLFFLVEKMDVIPSFGEEALPDSKEVEEDAAVPKNRDPELAVKQSVGQQKEMAGVLDAGNTFRANTTCEADTTYEASLEQLDAIIAAAETTCETLLHQIQKIWDEVGQCERVRKKMLHQLKQECLDVCKRKVNETVKSEAQLEQLQHTSSQSHAMDDECREILLQIQRECLNVYQRKFDQDEKSRDNLLKEMSLSKEELISLASVLGEQFVFPNKSAVMRKQFSDTNKEVQRLLQLKDAREEKFADVQSQIQKILEEIGGTSKLPKQAKAPAVDAEDL
ncbi:hypothetical protein MKW98_031511 [Papaver atlanticum]|uniref:RecQ-mediated genome instability protein 1 n=1 Tax=Papaver atlanticum TaxID=357466 RepID=A0AAD4X9D6_9MAGN|nr:hypothetical protein MKW98_031511 [Papaver atlanticum]